MGTQPLIEISNRELLHEYVLEVLQSKPHFFKNPESKETVFYLLTQAILLDEDFIVKLLIRYGADVHHENPLQVALEHGNIKCIELLLKNGAELEGPQWKGCSPAEFVFCFTPTNVRVELLQLLIKYGLKIDYRNCWEQNLLHLLADYVQSDDTSTKKLAEILLDSGVPIDEVDQENSTPLLVCLRRDGSKRDVELASFMIQRGADVKKCGASALSFAVEHADIDLFYFLMANKMDLKRFGVDALFQAIYYGEHCMISLLLQKGAYSGAVVSTREWTLFYLLTSKYRFKGWCKCQCIQLMIKEMAKLKSFDVSLVRRSDLEYIEKTPELREYFEECEAELGRMKETVFYRAHSYHSVLKMSRKIKKLARIVMDKQFVEKFEKNLAFDLYESDLQYLMTAAKQVNEERSAVYSRLKNHVFDDYFPDVVVEKFSNIFALKDLPMD